MSGVDSDCVVREAEDIISAIRVLGVTSENNTKTGEVGGGGIIEH